MCISTVFNFNAYWSPITLILEGAKLNRADITPVCIFFWGQGFRNNSYIIFTCWIKNVANFAQSGQAFLIPEQKTIKNSYYLMFYWAAIKTLLSNVNVFQRFIYVLWLLYSERQIGSSNRFCRTFRSTIPRNLQKYDIFG